MKYMLFCLIIFIICADLFACFMYCSVQQKRAEKKTSFQKDTSYVKAAKGNHSGILVKIGKLLQLSSLLRLNLFIISYIPSHSIRNFLYKYIFKAKLAKNAVIYYGAEIRAPWNLYIGEGSIIGDKSVLDARNGIKIGKNVNFSTGVWIWTEQHSVNSEDFAAEGAPVIIEDRCWCGPRTIILPGKTMKEGSVLAGGGVLTKDTEAFCIYGGIPAKKIGERNRNLTYNLNGNRFHFL